MPTPLNLCEIAANVRAKRERRALADEHGGKQRRRGRRPQSLDALEQRAPRGMPQTA